MQQEDAAIAASRPPIAISRCPLVDSVARCRCLTIMPEALHPVATTGSSRFCMTTITTARADGLAIGQLSKLTNVDIETIRYYEKIGMLPPPPRTEGGRREYGRLQTRMLVFIRRARELGFSLDEIRALLRLGGPQKATCGESRRLPRVTSKISAPSSAT